MYIYIYIYIYLLLLESPLLASQTTAIQPRSRSFGNEAPLQGPQKHLMTLLSSSHAEIYHYGKCSLVS